MELNVSRAGTQQTTPNGNLYVLCQTDKGGVAFWGSRGNTRNIAAILAASKRGTPFVVACRTVVPDNPDFREHDLWVPENERLEFLK